MSTPDYTQKIAELRGRVSQYSKLPKSTSDKGVLSTVIHKINKQSLFFYVIPPIVMVILLLFIKPGFCCTDNIDKDNVITKKPNYNKIFITGVISGCIISIGLFVYFHKEINSRHNI